VVASGAKLSVADITIGVKETCSTFLANPGSGHKPFFGVFMVPIGSRDGINIRRSIGLKTRTSTKQHMVRPPQKPFMVMSSHAPSEVLAVDKTKTSGLSTNWLKLRLHKNLMAYFD